MTNPPPSQPNPPPPGPGAPNPGYTQGQPGVPPQPGSPPPYQQPYPPAPPPGYQAPYPQQPYPQQPYQPPPPGYQQPYQQPPPGYQQPYPPPQYPQGYPPQPVYYAPPPQPQKKSCLGCSGCLLTGVIVLVVLCVLGAVTAGGGYLAYRNNMIHVEQRDVYALVGQAPGETSVINYSSGTVRVHLTSLAKTTETTGSDMILDFGLNDMTLAPDDMNSLMVEAGPYQLDFTTADGAVLSCMLTLRSNDTFQFAVFDSGIIVGKEGFKPSARADMMVPTSPLCQP